MLRALKRKFLLMTMSLISLVLLIVFAALLIGTYTQHRSMVDMSLAHALGQGFGLELPKEQFGRRDGDERLMTTITLLLDAQGNVLLSTADAVDISDADLSAAVAAALAGAAGQGWLGELGMYYMREATTPAQLKQSPGDAWSDAPEFGLPDVELSDFTPPDVELPERRFNSSDALAEALAGLPEDAPLFKLALVSDASMRRAMGDLILTSLMVGVGALVLLFGICLFLADWALRPVERTWNQQKRFISDASHELKTPLTVILANIDILRRHGRDTIESQRKWLDSAGDEAVRMKNLVEDLLTLARLDEAGQTAPMPELTDVNLTDAVWASLLTYEPVAFEQGLLLDSSVEPDVYVRGDEQKLRQLTTILLDNACKYAGRRGSVRVTLSAGADRAQLAVRNSGDVIPPENLEHLFERFYRADAARSGSKSGYGLGLSIAQGIARLHRGAITATSSEQDGTCFMVTLPRISAPEGEGR